MVLFSALKLKTHELGSGIHQWNLPLQRAVDLAHVSTFYCLNIRLWKDMNAERNQWNNGGEIIYLPTILITKVSILLMYLRLFMPNRRSKINHLTKFIIWVNVLFYLSVMIVAVFGCTPRRKIWQRWVPGKCVNEQAVWLVTAVVNTVSDVSILLLPVGCIWHLQLSLRRKLASSAIFATGSL